MPDAPQRPATGLLLVGGGIIVLFSLFPIQMISNRSRVAAVGIAALGLLFFLLGAWLLQREHTPQLLSRLFGVISNWMGIQTWQTSLLLMSVPLAVIVPIAAGSASLMTSPWIAIAAWLLAIGTAIGGGWRGNVYDQKLQWGVILTLLLITIIAFLPRGIATGHIPVLLTGDEGSMGIAASDFHSGQVNNFFNASWYSFPSFYFCIPALSIALLGRTTEALRIPSALAGALTVATVYFTGRAMFGKRTAALAAIFLAAYNYHIHFSRIGLNNIWDGLWYIVTIGALWIGWKQERRNAYLLAGLSLGLAQYFYPSARTLLVLVFAWLLLVGVMDRTRLKHALPHIALFILIASVVLLPLAWYYIGHPAEYLAPLARVSILGDWMKAQTVNSGLPAWRVLFGQLALGFQAYIFTPIRFWYEPGAPLLRPVEAALFILGTALLLLHPRDDRSLLLILWLLDFGLVGGLSESTPAAQRYVAVAPVCALVVGYGLGQSVASLAKAWPRRERIFSALAFLAMGFIVVSELNFYFRVYTPHNLLTEAQSNGMVAQRLANELQTRPSDTQVVFFGYPRMGFYSIPSVQFLAPGIEGLDISQPWGASENPKPSGKRLLFIFLPSNEDQIAPVQADYSGGKLQGQVAADGQILYWEYEYP